MSSVMSSYPFAGIGIITQQLAFFIIAYVLYSLINDERDINNYLIAIMIVSSVLVTVSLIFLFSSSFSLLDIITKNRIRISALITNAEASTNFYLISFPFLIALFLIKKKILDRILILLFATYLSFGLSLAMSRSAILGIAVSTAIIIYTLRRKRFYQLVFVFIGLGILFLFYEPLNETLTLFLRIEEGMSARDHIWSMSLNIIQDHPVFGIGPGAYKYEVFNYFPFMLDEWYGKLMIYFYNITEGVNFSHNYFLVLFTEMGIFGLITAIVLPIIYFRIGIKTIKRYRTESEEKYYLIIALFAIGTSVIFRNFFNSIGLLYLGGLTGDLPFWLIFSSLVYFYRAPLVDNSINPDQQKNRTWYGL
jgi:putative inorganic carbon (HCO3(-)) transporter